MKYLARHEFNRIVLFSTGQVGITVAIGWAEPANMYDPADLEASDRSLDFNVGWFIHPIYINGDYPEVMKSQVAAKSALQGYNESRLPEFSDAEKQRITGKLNVSVNIYLH